MSNKQKNPGQSSTKKGGLRSTNADSNQDGDDQPSPDGANVRPTGEVAEDIANIFAVLKQMSTELQNLGDIRKATMSMEGKLSSLVTRIKDVEGRLGFLEDAEEQRHATPPATKTEVEALREKVDDMEDRSRRNNLRFVGISEGSEAGDAIAFLEKTIPELLGIAAPTKGWYIERAHRIGPRLAPVDSNRCRTLIARFLRSEDRDKILRASQEKGELRLRDKRVMIFPDFSRGTQAKRDAFKDCKKALHERRVKFALQHPATLRIETREGLKRFDDPKKAMDFIRSSMG